ncbi:hypothetical protein SAMN05216480_109127 [Pustulibacterium marinum]|uniref:CarboxypepD_reg-like domain-containing protein n=1 Tax=Pustulibacterium marinum TaxID=1224947 RepID=A0A1I7HIS8_9FLAO|nr:hypothetical protein [Pustulibacterium marinum]SFU60670.1 hypothetical protein SAMN05216480_109127 [Pustulibacterium marinum]
MKRSIKLGVAAIAFLATTLVAQARSIIVAGLVVDSETMQPLSNAKVYDQEGKLLSKTNAKGYYKVTLKDLPDTGELHFTLQFKKATYADFSQKEHWGNLPDGFSSSLYIGMKKDNGNSKAFSELKSTADLSVTGIQNNFKEIQEKQQFYKAVDTAKSGNEQSVLTINNKTYLVSNTSYIALNSPKDQVSINGTKAIPASELNNKLKRKQITGLSQFEKNGRTTYMVYTAME